MAGNLKLQAKKCQEIQNSRFSKLAGNSNFLTFKVPWRFYTEVCSAPNPYLTLLELLSDEMLALSLFLGFFRLDLKGPFVDVLPKIGAKIWIIDKFTTVLLNTCRTTHCYKIRIVLQKSQIFLKAKHQKLFHGDKKIPKPT